MGSWPMKPLINLISMPSPPPLRQRLQIRAFEAFTGQVANAGNALAATATLTVERLRYPVGGRQSGASGGDRAIAGDI